MQQMTLTLLGLSDEDVADFRRVFGKLRSSLHADWRLSDDDGADLTVIDIDSIHGHMDWLKATGAGLRTAVYTNAQYAKESDLCLFKPLAADNLADILNAVAAESGASRRRPVAEAAPPVEEHETPVETAVAPAPIRPEPTTVRPPLTVVASSEAAVAKAPPVVAPPPTAAPAVVQAVAPVVVTPPSPPEPTSVGAALRVGGIREPKSITVGEDTWVLDPERDAYHGPATLKPLAAALRAPLSSLQAVDVVALEKARRTPTQPLARLRWYAGLLAAPGRLREGLDPNGRYMLSRWPQIEREFPRHFRIATAMMKQPGSLSEIAEASGAPLADVADFINASDALGIVAITADPLEASETPRGGMMSRIRKPFGR